MRWSRAARRPSSPWCSRPLRSTPNSRPAPITPPRRPAVASDPKPGPRGAGTGAAAAAGEIRGVVEPGGFAAASPGDVGLASNGFGSEDFASEGLGSCALGSAGLAGHACGDTGRRARRGRLGRGNRVGQALGLQVDDRPIRNRRVRPCAARRAAAEGTGFRCIRLEGLGLRRLGLRSIRLARVRLRGVRLGGVGLAGLRLQDLGLGGFGLERVGLHAVLADLGRGRLDVTGGARLAGRVRARGGGLARLAGGGRSGTVGVAVGWFHGSRLPSRPAVRLASRAARPAPGGSRPTAQLLALVLASGPAPERDPCPSSRQRDADNPARSASSSGRSGTKWIAIPAVTRGAATSADKQ